MGMTIERIVDVGSDDPWYPYRYRINVPRTNKTKISDVITWANETGFKCAVIPGAVFVHDEKDAVWFLLRWS